MELFLPFPGIRSKILSQKIPHLVKQFQNGFQRQEMELSKQEMELFPPFQSLDQKTSLRKVFPFFQMIPNWFSETANGII
jgi:hypothetical protein